MKHLFASCAVIALMAAPALAQSTYEPTEPLVESEQALDPTMREEAEEATDFEREAEPVAETGPVDEAGAEADDKAAAESIPPADQSMTAETPVADSDPMFGTETVATAETFEAPIDIAELPEEYSTADLNAMMLAQLNVVAAEIAEAQEDSGTNVYASSEPVTEPDMETAMTESVEPAGETATMADETDDGVQMAEQTDGMMVTAEGDIDQTAVEIAARDDRFTTLVELVGLAGLEDSLNADGPYTVFAPTNEAFAALPEETLTRLKSEEGKAELTEILKSHVAEGRLMAGEVPMAGQSVETIGEGSLNVTGSVDGTLNIEGSNTVGDGIYASNGVVYAVDAVILPEATPEPAVTPEN